MVAEMLLLQMDQRLALREPPIQVEVEVVVGITLAPVRATVVPAAPASSF